MTLQEYRRKRDFRVTAEPRGGRGKSQAQLSFVVQKHAASHLHYDFRLELDGVLKSWAVPKGPSLDPTTKRLAMQVEDHPIEYGSFEGIIPAGEYGGGTVMLWDRGTWEPSEDARSGYNNGALKFFLHGEKLRGGWMLVRKGGRRSGSDERHWFLFKENDRYASSTIDITAKKPRSVTTGRDLEAIAQEARRVWGKEGETVVKKQPGKKRVARRATIHGGKPAPPRRSTASDHNIAGVALTHPDKILYAEDGITKLDLARYYEQAAAWMLPQVENRLLTLVRCPAGSGGKCFFQKHPGAGTSEYLKRFEVREKRQLEEYLALYDLPGLIALVQMGVLEIHLWGSQADQFEKPDRLIFDLDPDPAVDWPHLVTAAKEVRLFLEELGLESFLKTTGGKGLHIVVPIRRTIDWAEAKTFCHSVADALVAAAPDRYIATMSKAARKGKIFVDYLRNDRGATAIAPYSTRARPGAPVSAPVEWAELDRGISPAHFTVQNMPARLQRLKQDPWAQISKTRQSITARMTRQLRLR